MQNPVTPTFDAPRSRRAAVAAAKSPLRFSGVMEPMIAPKSVGSTPCEREKKSGAITR